jgi:hypothetical protein
MKLFHRAKDGGDKSNVTGYWLIEWKRCFSIALLRFDRGSRDAFHNHAFNSISWVLPGGLLMERTRTERRRAWCPDRPVIEDRLLKPSWRPVFTSRARMHKVFGMTDATWVLTFRGPWVDTWQEVRRNGRTVTLTHGREQV